MDGNISVCYNMDCMEGMAKIPDGYFDLATFPAQSAAGIMAASQAKSACIVLTTL
mgnify:CR=1 FL=1